MAAITPESELKDAAGELVELSHNPHNIDELADVFGCLIGYAVKIGWDCDDVERALMKKLQERFEHGPPLPQDNTDHS